MWLYPLNKTLKQSLYRQLIQRIETAIQAGDLLPGQRIPSERRLSQQLQVNRSTVLRAIHELTDRGVLLRKVGSGTFINQEKWGLQNYQLFNWHPPIQLQPQTELDHYARQCLELRQNATNNQTALIDLANGDLPDNLLPEPALLNLDWQEMLRQEHNSDNTWLGLDSLRSALSYHLQQQHGIAAQKQQILVTAGTQQALFLITQGLLKPGDAIATETPSYFYSLPLFQAAGLRLYGIPLDEDGIDLDELAKLTARQRIKMLFINPVFQNPTGNVMSHRRKMALLQFCLQRQIPIVEDDAYSLLSFSPNTDVRPLKHFDKYDQVIYLGSLSKYVGKHLRIGWMVAPSAIINKLARIRQYIDSGLSSLPQVIAQHYLQNKAATHRALLCQQLRRRADKLQHWLQQQYGTELRFQPPRGGLNLYVEQSAGSKLDLLSALLQQGVIVTSGTEFGASMLTFRANFAHFDGI